LSRRVVATGVGVVSCLGTTAPEHFRRLLVGESGVAPLTGSRGRGLPVHFELPVQGFDPRRAIRNRMLRKLLQPSGAYAVAAAGEALADAGLASTGRGEEEGGDPRMAAAGLFFGSVSYDLPSRLYVPALRASFGPDERFSFERFGRQGVALVDPLLIVKGLPNAALCGIAIEHGIQGPNANFANGAVAGLEAVIAAAAAVRRGEVEVAVAGGSDCLLQPEHLIEHTLRERLWTGEAPRATACRPFAAGRQGYLPGEGAAAVVLESADHARERGARAWAEVLGDGETAAGPGGEEEALAAAASFALAGALPDALFAQGIGTPADDLREARVAEALFGGRVPVTAATGALGYTGAAGGILAFVHALWSLARGWLPPTVGCDEPDPGCPVPLVRAAERRPLATALAWATDEGRKNAAVLCGRAAESR
jgi:3-oxoacyl-(acyl-carrier-protein) synthase